MDKILFLGVSEVHQVVGIDLSNTFKRNSESCAQHTRQTVYRIGHGDNMSKKDKSDKFSET